VTVKRRPKASRAGVSGHPEITYDAIRRAGGAIHRAPTAFRRSVVPVLTIRLGMFQVPGERA